MCDDTGLTLAEIHDASVQKLIDQLIQIQRHTISREKAEAWADRLRFLSISGIASEGEKTSKRRRRVSRKPQDESQSFKILPLTGRWLVSKRNAYISISWRWRQDLPADETAGWSRYRVQRRKEQPHISKVPDIYLDRAIRFAKSHGVRLLWVDAECIHQEDPEDQETGIQSMDMVYRNSRLSLGILNVVVHKQQLVDGLSALLDGSIFDRSVEEPRFEKWVDPGLILDILRLILSDERWSRTWIFQEDHCASSKMVLLVPHASSLFKNPDILGDIDGELQISCATFRHTATLFFLARDERGYEYDNELASKVRQYNVVNQVYGTVPITNNVDSSSEEPEETDKPCALLASSLSILDDIRLRQNSIVSDRLAIWANCCRYYARLDASGLAQTGFGLSTCYLCLYLLNGEILYHERNTETTPSPNESTNLLDQSIYDFLNHSALAITFDPPCEEYRQSFIDKYCRLGGVELTPEGTRTTGWLWEISDVLTFNEQDTDEIAKRLADWEDESPECEDSAMGVLSQRLQDHGCDTLATTLGEYMNAEPRSNDEKTERYHFFVDKMLESVMEALRQEKTLHLAHLAGDPESRALFIGPNGIRPEKVFTGFWKEEEKFVSIEVQHQAGTDDERARLYPQSWINGVWFAPRGTRKTFVFPYPFAKE